ncbi:hypothetical protein [Paenibacillus popilliae]|nr:hypothetical protein [Paenibacillus popilliae]
MGCCQNKKHATIRLLLPIGLRGSKKANMALAHLMLRIIFIMLRTGVPYEELGQDDLPKKEKDVNYWVHKIKQRGYNVELQELGDAG